MNDVKKLCYRLLFISLKIFIFINALYATISLVIVCAHVLENSESAANLILKWLSSKST